MIGFVVMACIAGHIQRGELPMLNYWPNVGLSRLFAEAVLIITLVSGNRL